MPKAATSLALVLASLALLSPPSFAQAPAFLTQWGSNGTGIYQFNSPNGLLADASGLIYVADTGNNLVKVFTPQGNLAGAYPSIAGIGPGAIAESPSGEFYVTSATKVYRFTHAWVYEGQFGAYGGATPGSFWGTGGVAFDADGNFYISDFGNNRLQVYTSTGTYLREWAVTSPWGLAIDPAGHVFVSASNDNHVQEFTTAGVFVRAWGTPGTGNGQFNTPASIALDQRGNVYVVDHGNYRVQVFSNAGQYLAQWGSQGPGNGQFMSPFGIAVDLDDNVYVTDGRLDIVQKFGPVPTPTRTASWGSIKAAYR